MRIHQIVRWDTGAVLWDGEAKSVKDAIHQALAARANLSGANLSGADLWRATLSGADLSGANLSGADLWRTTLSGADLSRADLWRTTLSGADLSGADLSRTNLWRTNLSRANGVVPARSTPLLMLLEQPGAIRAYKLVTSDLMSPNFHGGPLWTRLSFVLGEVVRLEDANTDVSEQCGAGINVATLDWCLANHQHGMRVLVVEFTAADIAAIPTATDGKFRLHRCTVVGEVDLMARGLLPSAAPALKEDT